MSSLHRLDDSARAARAALEDVLADARIDAIEADRYHRYLVLISKALAESDWKEAGKLVGVALHGEPR